MELLIASFFLLVGAEIRNELEHRKELVAPLLAAIGGMVAPAILFKLMQPESEAWGAVMPTDITLALAVIALLGKRIDPKLRLFVLALAVADDFLSLIAIGIFYSGKLNLATSASTIFAAAIGVESKRGVLPIRKKGKLPHEVHREEYGLEYGTDIIEIHKDAAKPGETVLLVDDVLATGGTLAAAIKLIERTGATVNSVAVLLEIAALGGREKLLAQFPNLEINAIFIV